MRVSLKACNGSVIEPGATWSFNKCTGNSNLESLGYKPAGVISNGKSDIGIGGGICQSSSTIYNAAVRANMKVEERYCHKWASSYVPTGLDATIDYGNLDLKLSNPTDYQMFLECKVVDNTLYISFWGWKSDSYDLIMTRNKLTNQGSSSYTVKAWRVYYKDGKEIDSESLGSSTYDTENGYVFIDANNDPRAKYGDDVVIPDETVPKNDDSSSSSSIHSHHTVNRHIQAVLHQVIQATVHHQTHQAHRATVHQASQVRNQKPSHSQNPIPNRRLQNLNQAKNN